MSRSTGNQGHRRPFYQSLRARIGIFLLLLAILAGGVFFFGWLPQYQQTNIDEQRDQVDEHLATLADALLPYLIQDQLGAVHETLDALLERQPEWRVLILTDQRGKRLYPLFPAQTPRGDVIYRFTQELRLRGQSYGRLTLDVDATPLLAKSKRRNHELAAIFAGVFLTAFIFIALFLELIAGRPTRQLTRAAQRLAEGDYEAQLPVPGKDEVGELIRSFDQMRDTIRTKEVSLIEAHRQAESANRAKSMFLANMSHELRTPLNAVLGFAQLLETDPGVTSGQKQRIGIIQRSGKHLLDLLTDLLDLSKIEAGSMEAVAAPFDLPDLLSEIEDMFRPRADAKNILFTVSTCRGAPETVVSDLRKIRQVLLNVVGNAFKFTDQGSVRLHATCHPVGNLVFDVTDTGSGISAEMIESIFDPFERGDQEHSNRDGAGLGLAISKRFTELLGGNLQVTSRIGQGSTFSVSIPVTVADSLQPAVDSPTPGFPSPAPKKPNPAREVLQTRIPGEILDALADACSSLDFASVNESLSRAEQADPETHARFAELAEDFRYEELEKLVRNFLKTAYERQVT